MSASGKSRSGIAVREIDLGDGRSISMTDHESFSIERLRLLQTALSEWLAGPLSEENKAYRLDSIASAFGLRRSMFEEVAAGGHFRGGFHLLQEIVLWTEGNADAGLNAPVGPDHPFRDLKLD